MTEQQILDVLSAKAKTSRPHARFLDNITRIKHSNPQLYARLIEEMSKCSNEQELLDKLEE